MFERLLSALKNEEFDQDMAEPRRRHERREKDMCVTVIGGKTFPVENWSQGGVLIYGDSRPFNLHQEIVVTMKFKLRDSVLDLVHRARIVRKSYERVALEFAPLSDQIKRGFQAVIDDQLAGDFADSQLV